MRTKASERVLLYGSRRIPYQLRVMPRKRLRIVVKPDLTVRADAPNTFSETEIHEAVGKRARWIARQLDEMERYHPLPKPHRYVSGETVVYLGRQYRLRVEAGAERKAKLKGRFLHVETPEPKKTDAVRASVEEWYRKQAHLVFSRYLERCLDVGRRHGIAEPILCIRKMRTRWGSCSPSGRITLNLHLIQAPVHCIEYVIMHELCHLKHHDHSPAFYRLLTRCMPDWKKRRAILREVVTASPNDRSVAGARAGRAIVFGLR